MASHRVDRRVATQANTQLPSVDPVLARLAVAQTGPERCELLGQLQPSEDTQATYAITGVLERTQFVSVRVCGAQALALQPTAEARSWLIDLADDAEPAVHGAALEALAASSDSGARVTVIEATHSDDPEVRLSAVTALLKAGREEAFSALPSVLPSIDDRLTLSTLIEALGQAHDPRALPLLESLIDSADHDSHLAAINALGDLGTPAAIPRLDALLTVGSEDEFRAAADALGKLEPSGALARFRRLLASPNAQRQILALSELAKLDAPEVLSIMSEQLRSGDPQRIRPVLQRLSSHAEPSLEAQITEIARQSDEARTVHQRTVRGLALRALVEIGTPSALATVREIGGMQADMALDRHSHEVEETPDEARVRLISELESDPSPQTMLALARDPAEAAQAAALRYVQTASAHPEYLSYFTTGATVSSVLQFAEHAPNLDRAQKRWWIQGLAQRGEPRFSALLRAASRDDEAEIRQAALRGLAAMGDESALADARRLTQASDPSERSLAVELLGARTDAAATNELAALAADPSPEVAGSALLALQTRAADSVSRLAQRAFRSASAEDRVTLLSSLGELRSNIARPLYDLALSEGDEGAVLQAVQALINLSGPESAQSLLGLVTDVNRSPDVRREAATGLRQLGGPLARANRALLDSLSEPDSLGAYQCPAFSE
jgi:HEAT repeat protein